MNNIEFHFGDKVCACWKTVTYYLRQGPNLPEWSVVLHSDDEMHPELTTLLRKLETRGRTPELPADWLER